MLALGMKLTRKNLKNILAYGGSEMPKERQSLNDDGLKKIPKGEKSTTAGIVKPIEKRQEKQLGNGALTT